MRRRTQAFALALALSALATGPARACGGGEAPSACGGSGEGDAKWMLQRVVAAIAANKPKALLQFAHGEGGFRTVDTYVFCVGPDAVMTAHPSAILQGQDVHDLHDETGNYFIATMLNTAKPGQVSEIHYLFPRPGSTVAAPKTTFYTRATDQVCGVGVYDGDDAPASAGAPEARMAELRRRLGAKMPASLEADWAAFLQATDEATSAQAATFAKAREQVAAAGALLAAAAPAR